MTGIVMEGWSPAPQGTHLPELADGERHAMVSLVRTWLSDPGGVVLFLGTWPTLPEEYKHLHAELSQHGDGAVCEAVPYAAYPPARRKQGGEKRTG